MKKILSTMLVITLLLTNINYSYAQIETQYDAKAVLLNELGLLQGSDAGYELERAPKRIEAAVMLCRLLGKEAELKKGSYKHPFTDVPSWANNYIGYMYENKLTQGIGNNLFGSNDLTVAKSYGTFVLRALGYDDSKNDFIYSEAVQTLKDKGIISTLESNRLGNEVFLRDDMVNISYNALATKLNQNSKTLVESLVESKAVNSQTALKQRLVDEIFANLHPSEEVTPPVTTPVATTVQSGTDLSKAKSAQNSKYIDIPPMLNVAPDHEFMFQFNSYMFGAELLPPGYIKVYSDEACTEQVFYDANYDRESENIFIVQPPKESYSDRTRSFEDSLSKRSWGGYTKFYLVVETDVKSSTFKLLDKPIRMMFTIKSEVEVPRVSFSLNEQGLATLSWQKVTGASEYRIYNAYSKNYTYDLYTSVTSNSFSNFSLDDGFDIGLDTSWFNMFSNQDFRNHWMVSAVVNGKESRPSNIISADEYETQVPSGIYNNDPLSAYHVVDLVEYTTVYMLDYDVVKDYPVVYNFTDTESITNSFGLKKIVLKYQVFGTSFFGEVVLPADELTPSILAQLTKDQNERVKNLGVLEETVTLEDKTDVQKTPEPSKEVTEQIKKAEVSYNLTFEEALTQAMISGNKTLNIKPFPVAYDMDKLVDTLLKVKYQNPLVLYFEDASVDFNTGTLELIYSDKQSTAAKKQQEIQTKVKQIVSTVVKSGMSEYDKEFAIHDYLIKNCEYDVAALENGAKYDYKYVDSKFDDSFNAYGVLINNLGVCASYAAAYKLLCDEAGIDCVVITGNASGIGHAWNKVELGGTYYNVDPTFNDNDLSYIIFNASDASVKMSHTEDKSYELDERLSDYASVGNKYDYFVLNDLDFSSESELKSILSAQSSKTVFIAKKLNQSMSQETALEAISNILYDMGYSSFKYGVTADVFMIYPVK